MIWMFLACSVPAEVSPPPIDDQLFAWLDANAGDRRILLPVRVQRSPIAIESAAVVCETGDLPLHLDSTAMSRMLTTTLGPEGDVVWLEGTWGPVLGDPDPARPTLSVRDVRGTVEGRPTTIRFP